MELKVGDEEEEYLYCIFCKVKNWIMEKISHTIRSICACVWNFWMELASLFAHLSFLFLSWDMGYLSFFSFFSFPYFWARICFFLSFCIANIFLHDEYEELCQSDGVLLYGWKTCFLRNFHCRSPHMSVWVDESR